MIEFLAGLFGGILLGIISMSIILYIANAKLQKKNKEILDNTMKQYQEALKSIQKTPTEDDDYVN